MSRQTERTPLHRIAHSTNRPIQSPHPAAEQTRMSSKPIDVAAKPITTKPTSNRDVESLQKELDQLHSRVKRRDALIAEMKAAESSNMSRNAAEKLQDLVQKHQAAKITHESEIAELGAENARLQKSLSAAQTQLKTSHGATDLRKALSSAEGEVVALRREVQSLREANDAEVRARVDERTRLNEQLKANQREREDLEDLLEDSAMMYQALHHNTVSRAVYRDTKDKLDGMIARDLWNRERVHDLKLQVTILGDERDLLRDWLAERQAAKEESEEMVQALLEDRRADALLSCPTPPAADNVATSNLESGSLDPAIFDVALAHIDLSHVHYSSRLAHTESELTDVVSQQSTVEAALLTAETALSSLRRSHAQLQMSHQNLEELHAPCGEAIVSLKGDIEQLKKVQGDLSRMVDERDRGLRLAEELSKKLQQGVKRSEDKVVRRLMGEQALEDEIAELREALERAAPFEEMYTSLLEEHQTILTREEMALDEADRLGVQNAELIGTVSAAQRVGYVEGVRREMALVKHALATTRISLNKANDLIAELQGEVQAYKSIDAVALAGASGGRTKVVRRQPEGSGLVGGAGRRSVSATVRR